MTFVAISLLFMSFAIAIMGLILEGHKKLINRLVVRSFELHLRLEKLEGDNKK